MKKLLNIVKIGALCLVLVLLGYMKDTIKENSVDYKIKPITTTEIAEEALSHIDDNNYEYISYCKFDNRHDIWDMSLKIHAKTNGKYTWWKNNDGVEYELYNNDDAAWLVWMDYENEKYYIFNYTRPESYNNNEKKSV